MLQDDIEVLLNVEATADGSGLIGEGALLTVDNIILRRRRRTTMNLAAYIEQDLRYRIEAGKSLPEPLTLTGVSRDYGVSITPTRAAIGRLIDDGLLIKQANKRLTVNADRAGKGSTKRNHLTPSAPKDWDEALMREVMMTSRVEEATYLREEALAKKLKVGRSVIRQTLSRFAGAGLVEHVPRCGWLVHPLNEDDVHAYLEVREALELKALDQARPHILPEDIDALLEGNPPPREGAPPQLDNALHLYLIRKSGNRYIRDFFRQYVARYYTALFDHATPEAAAVAEMAAQHRDILKHLRAKEWDEAGHALSEHIRSQGVVLHSLLELDRSIKS